MSGYNGWTNYETWRVNLELFNDMELADMWGTPDADTRDDDVRSVAGWLEDYAYEIVEEEAKGWALDIAKSFLAQVDFEEIAEHMVDDYLAEV